MLKFPSTCKITRELRHAFEIMAILDFVISRIVQNIRKIDINDINMKFTVRKLIFVHIEEESSDF